MKHEWEIAGFTHPCLIRVHPWLEFRGLQTMPRISAGLLMYRIKEGRIQVLLAHPCGPFFKNKDAGVWTIPKGEPEGEGEEDLLLTAQREFEEETGIKPHPPFIPLTPIQQKGGKI